MTALKLPVQAVAWACHAATTIKDASGAVLAECIGHGNSTAEDEALAAEIVRRINAHDELLAALVDMEAFFFTRGSQADDAGYWAAIGKARAAISAARGAA